VPPGPGKGFRSRSIGSGSRPVSPWHALGHVEFIEGQSRIGIVFHHLGRHVKGLTPTCPADRGRSVPVWGRQALASFASAGCDSEPGAAAAIAVKRLEQMTVDRSGRRSAALFEQ